MRRREFVTLVGGALAASSFMARAQQRATPVIGFLNGSSATAYRAYVEAFVRGLAETGLHRRGKCGDRILLGRGPLRWHPRYGRRPRPSSGCRPRSEHAGSARCKAGRQQYPDCLLYRPRRRLARRLRSCMLAAKKRSTLRSMRCAACESTRCSCSLMLFSSTSGS